MIPGGLTEARPATAEVQEIADRMDVGGGCFTHIKVFKDLSGKNNLELTGYQTNKTEDDELTYF
uniref:Cystatin A1 n=1 Tax=Mus musculus TaxID=10090 RepID=E0CZ96_MOUSE